MKLRNVFIYAIIALTAWKAVCNAGTTPNLQLVKPDRGAVRWDLILNSNMDKLDAGYGNNVATIADLPETYIETGTFNYTTGTTITLPKAVDNINEYNVTVMPTSRGAAIGDIYVTKTTGNFTVKCSENNTSDSFAAVIHYIGDVNSYGGAIYRRWYVSPDAAITDHSVNTTAGSLAWILAQIGSSPAVVELPANKTYTLTANSLTVDDATRLVFQPGAVVSIASGKTLTINGEIAVGLFQIFTGDGTVSFGDRYNPGMYPQWWNGAAGDGSTDCAAAIQAAIDAAAGSAAGYYRAVYLTPGKYVITDTIYLKTAPIIGVGGMINSGIRIIWDGPAGVTAFEKNPSHEGNNSFVLIENINFRSGLNRPDYWLDFSTNTNTVDSFHRLRELQFYGTAKTCIRIGRWVNCHWENLRFDQWGEYCIEFKIPTTPLINLSTFVLDRFSADARTLAAKGFFHVDASAQYPSNAGPMEVANGRIEINDQLQSGNPGLWVITVPDSSNPRGFGFKLRNVSAQDSANSNLHVLYRVNANNTTASESIIIENCRFDSLAGLVGGTPGSSFNNVDLPVNTAYMGINVNPTSNGPDNVFDETLFAPFGTYDAWRLRNKNDTYDRVVLDNSGYLNFGGGSAATDVRLYRIAANILGLANGDSYQLEGTWNGGHLIMRGKHIWVDSTGDMRIKSGAPTSDTDGTVIGTQN